MQVFDRLSVSIKNAKIPIIIILSSFAAGPVLAFFYQIPDDGIFANTELIFTILADKPDLEYYLLRLICEIIVLSIAFCCGFAIFTFPISWLIVLYRGFLLGITLKALLFSYSVAGFVIGVFVVIPSFLISLFAIVCCTVFSINRLDGKKFSSGCDSRSLLCEYLLCLTIALISVLYILLAQVAVILPLNYTI